jgi:hypothetical protein
MSLPFAESDGFASPRERKKLKMDSRLRGNDDEASSIRRRQGKFGTATMWRLRYDDDSRTIA